MIYRQSAHFKKAFGKLPLEIQERAREALSLFAANPRHPSLVMKRVKGTRGRTVIWEARATDSCRFTFHYETDSATGQKVCVFRNIGGHDITRTDP